MNFKPDLAQAVMAGHKTVTRRLVSDNPNSPWWAGACSLHVGRDYAVCPGRGKNAIGRVKVTGIRQVTLGHLSGEEAQREGFPHRQAFEAAWKSINGAYDSKALVWRVKFVVAEILECKACRHPGDDCICWYIAETEAIERVEAVA